MDFEVKRGGHKDLKRIYPMMEFDFRGEGLIAQGYLHLALINGAAELLLLKDLDGRELGYAFVQKAEHYDYVLPAYIAVYPTFRGAGAGTRFLELIRERYANKQGIFLEVFGDSDGAKKTRALYERLGWQRVGCKYRLRGTPSTLMLLRLSGPEDVAPVAPVIIEALYKGVLPDRKIGEFVRVMPEG